MPHFEYLSLKITGSKGSLNADTFKEMSWNHVILVITKNGASTVQHLACGIENIEKHFDKQLTHYKQQGWQPIKVESPSENSQNRYFKKTIYCLLKRSIELEPSHPSEQLSKISPKFYPKLSMGA